MTDFARRIEEELEYLGLKKSDIVKHLKIADSTVRSWWSKDSIPAADVALKVADFLKVPLPYLLDGRKENTQIKTLLSDYEKHLIQEARDLTQEDKIELMAYIAMKKSMYRMIKADNGKTAIVKDC